MVGFLFATIAAGLATFLPWWLALLIVTLVPRPRRRDPRTDRAQQDQEGVAARAGAGDPRGEAHRGGAQAMTARTQAQIQSEIEAEREQLAERGRAAARLVQPEAEAARAGGRRGLGRVRALRRGRRHDAVLRAAQPRRLARDSAASAPVAGRVVRGRQANRLAVHRRRLHGTRAGGRLQLAARVLPRGDRAGRAARPDQRVRRTAELPRPGRAEGGHAADRLVPAGLGRLRARSSRSSSGWRWPIWAASGAMGSVVKAVNRTYDRVETRPFWKVKLISIAARARLGARDRRRCCS